MKKLLPLLILSILILSCSSVKTVPEITPHLQTERIAEYDKEPDIVTIAVNGDSAVMVRQDGSFTTIPETGKKYETLLEYGKSFTGRNLQSGNMLALKVKENGKTIFFDIEKRKIVFEAEKKWLVMGLGARRFLHLKGRNIAVVSYPGGTQLWSGRRDKDKYFGSDFSGDRVILLFRRGILIIDTKNQNSEEIELGVNPVSPFLFKDGSIYFGDDNRSLIRFSLNKKKIVWKYKFQMPLVTKPLVYRNLIIASPKDNNSYIITKRGGVKDWYKLGSGRLFDPVLMKDHLAVFLRTEEGTLINYFGLKDHSNARFEDKSLAVQLPPVYFKKYLYSVGREVKNEQLKIVKIGNIFGCTIKIDPPKFLETGKAVRFTINPVNMYKATISATIYNDKNEQVFFKETDDKNDPSFAWVPAKEGSFKLEIITKDRDGKETLNRENLMVSDISKIYRDIQFRIHKQADKKPENGNETKDQ